MDGMRAVGRTFAKSKELLELNVSRNERIGDEGMQAFCEGASSDSATVCDNNDATTKEPLFFQSLKVLDVSECKIGLAGLESLVTLLLTTSKGAPCTGEALLLRCKLTINLNLQSIDCHGRNVLEPNAAGWRRQRC